MKIITKISNKIPGDQKQLIELQHLGEESKNFPSYILSEWTFGGIQRFLFFFPPYSYELALLENVCLLEDK